MTWRGSLHPLKVQNLQDWVKSFHFRYTGFVKRIRGLLTGFVKSSSLVGIKRSPRRHGDTEIRKVGRKTGEEFVYYSAKQRFAAKHEGQISDFSLFFSSFYLFT